MGSNTLKGYTVGTPALWALIFWMLLRRHVLPDFSTLISQCSSKSCYDAARRFMLLSWWCLFRTKKEHLPTRQFIKVDRLIPRAGHSLIFSRFAIRSPLNFFPWIADAHAFIFWISLFARRSNARRSASGSLSEKELNHSSLSVVK